MTMIHYANIPMLFMQRFLKAVKMLFLEMIMFDMFLIVAQNVDCGYTLVGGSNVYQQSLF